MTAPCFVISMPKSFTDTEIGLREPRNRLLQSGVGRAQRLLHLFGVGNGRRSRAALAGRARQNSGEHAVLHGDQVEYVAGRTYSLARLPVIFAGHDACEPDELVGQRRHVFGKSRLDCRGSPWLGFEPRGKRSGADN